MQGFDRQTALDEFDRLAVMLDRVLAARLNRGLSAGLDVVIVAPDGEVDGVENGTTGTFEGVIFDLCGRALAAVRLDDNGATVYVRAEAVQIA